MNKLKNIIKSIIPQIILNPIYLCENSLTHLIINTIKTSANNPNEKWLDVGCGTRPYESYFPNGTYFGVDVNYSGRDLSLKLPDFFYDGHTLPFQDESYDGVICTQVLEHVKNPVQIISEISRVLKPNGKLILSIPFAWQEHEEPFDFFRYSAYGVELLITEAGFNSSKVSKDLGAIESLAVLTNVYITNNLSSKYISYLVNIFVCFPIQLFALVFQKFLPDQKKFYLNLVVTAKKNN